MRAAEAAGAAHAAEDVAFQTDVIAGLDRRHTLAGLVDNAAYLMAENPRQHHPPRHAGCPVEDLHVRSADPGSADLDPDLAGTGVSGFPVANLDTAGFGCGLAKREHQR